MVHEYAHSDYAQCQFTKISTEEIVSLRAAILKYCEFDTLSWSCSGRLGSTTTYSVTFNLGRIVGARSCFLIELVTLLSSCTRQFLRQQKSCVVR